MKLTEEQVRIIESALNQQGGQDIVIRGTGEVRFSWLDKTGKRKSRFFGKLWKTAGEISPVKSKTPFVGGSGSFKEFGKNSKRENVCEDAAGVILSVILSLQLGNSPKLERINTYYGNFIKISVGEDYLLVNGSGYVRYAGNNQGEWGVSGIYLPEGLLE